jgi:hypothetical protein
MVLITETQTDFIFEIKGLHKIWALKSKITIPKNQVIIAYQNKEELNNWKGFRVGTYIPFLITAGTYLWSGKRNFWDSMRSKNTIIVQLENHYFNKLYIDVKNPSEAITLLNNK